MGHQPDPHLSLSLLKKYYLGQISIHSFRIIPGIGDSCFFCALVADSRNNPKDWKGNELGDTLNVDYLFFLSIDILCPSKFSGLRLRPALYIFFFFFLLVYGSKNGAAIRRLDP